jgi:hypothetical protein
VRWQGQVVANKSELHTFHITTDDGARLWVDGKLIIDDWAAHTKRERSSAASPRGRQALRHQDDNTFFGRRWPRLAGAVGIAELHPGVEPVRAAQCLGWASRRPVRPTGFRCTNTQVNRRPSSAG